MLLCGLYGIQTIFSIKTEGFPVLSKVQQYLDFKHYYRENNQKVMCTEVKGSHSSSFAK